MLLQTTARNEDVMTPCRLQDSYAPAVGSIPASRTKINDLREPFVAHAAVV
jgi:hypothetical protein